MAEDGVGSVASESTAPVQTQQRRSSIRGETRFTSVSSSVSVSISSGSSSNLTGAPQCLCRAHRLQRTDSVCIFLSQLKAGDFLTLIAPLVRLHIAGRCLGENANRPVNLTVVVLLLLPCVLLLLLLNCFFLVYKLLILIKRKRRRREDTEEVLLRSTLPRVRLSDAVFSPLQDAGRAYMSVSEPVLPHPVTSSRASSRERLGVNHRVRLLRPDGATGSGSLRAPSSIRAASSAFTPRLEAPWSRSAPVLTQSTCSETETRINLVPPNSPTMEHIGHMRRSSTREKLSEAAVHPFDKVMAECEFTDPMTDMSCLNTTAVGPGLDSDFGASAGVSLRILSADSDGLSNGVLASALEWDYYDPCYVKQNNIPKHKHPIPAIHTRQYWV